MKNKEIIILIALILLAFVGYKLISSNIQENKEKSVLQEKYRLEQLKIKDNTDEINSCIGEAKNISDKDTAYIGIMARCWAVGILDNNSMNDCVNNEGRGRQICQLQKGICTEQISMKLKAINEKFDKDKQDCYIRYK